MLLHESRHVSWDLSCSLPSFPLSTTPITHSTLYPTRTSDLTSVLGSWKGPHAPGRVCEDDEKKQEALNRCHLFLKCEQRRCCAQARETSSLGRKGASRPRNWGRRRRQTQVSSASSPFVVGREPCIYFLSTLWKKSITK